MAVEQGDVVILQVFTCPAVPTPVVCLGATPVYVDIDPGTFNMAPDRIEAKITKKTKVIIAQHSFGIPAEMDPILDIARKHSPSHYPPTPKFKPMRWRGRLLS